MSASKPLTNEDLAFLESVFEYQSDVGILFHRELRRPVGSLSKQGYVRTSAQLPSGRRILAVHNIAWYLYYHEWPDCELDHCDQDKANNRIVNLRRSTRQLNQANIGKPRSYAGKSCTSRYKGVVWHSRDCIWQANIRLEGQNKYLGTFTDEVDAAKAYNRAAMAAFGEFAVLNEVNA